jgi:hypothetical protein
MPVAAGPVPASAEPARRRGSGAVAGGKIKSIPGSPCTPASDRSRAWFVGPVSPRLPRPRRRRNVGAWRALRRGHGTRGYGRVPRRRRGHPEPSCDGSGHRTQCRCKTGGATRARTSFRVATACRRTTRCRGPGRPHVTHMGREPVPAQTTPLAFGRGGSCALP